jgi:hypothetical protein
MNDDRAALLEGLETLRQTGPRGVYARRGTTTQLLQARISGQEASMLRVATLSAGLITEGRISQAVVVRRALAHYAPYIVATLRDPAAAAAEREEIEAIQRGEKRSGP